MTGTVTPQNATWEDLQERLHQRRTDPVAVFAKVLIPDHGQAPLPADPEYRGWKAIADFAQDEAKAYRKLPRAPAANLRSYVADRCVAQWWEHWAGSPLPDSSSFGRQLWRDAVDVLFDALNAQAAERKAERLAARAGEQARAA